MQALESKSSCTEMKGVTRSAPGDIVGALALLQHISAVENDCQKVYQKRLMRKTEPKGIGGVICGLIRIDDNPSIDIAIPKRNWNIGVFRQTDRLWMLSPSGIDADLRHKGITNPSVTQRQEQIEHSYSRFKDERSLYNLGRRTYNEPSIRDIY